ncbi:hypothetical protein a10_09254 [Streptomyces acidiscabies]|nr:hypothetical protein a10_09254 [Streptomyces acidiscabies]
MGVVHHDGIRPGLQQFVDESVELRLLKVDDAAIQLRSKPCLPHTGDTDQNSVATGINLTAEHCKCALPAHERGQVRHVVRCLERSVKQSTQVRRDAQKVPSPSRLTHEVVNEPFLGVNMRCWEGAPLTQSVHCRTCIRVDGS